MAGSNRLYRCEECGGVCRGSQLKAGAWGDPGCPGCGSPRVVRHRTLGQEILGTYFLFKVY
jgi:hypothetical protein